MSFTANGTQTVDFSTTIAGVNNGTFNGTGLTPTPASGQLDSDGWAISGMSDGSLAFGGTATTGDFARGSSTGGVTTGGLYAYTSTAGLFVQPGGSDFNPGTITLRIQNNGTVNITQFTVNYNILANNDQARANSFNFSHSPDDTTYTPVPALDYTSTEVADALGFQTINRNTIITGLAVTPGSFFYLRWSSADVSGAGSRDELGLDDIAVTAQYMSTAASGTITGRARMSNGNGVKYAVVTLIGGGLDEPIYATTNQFGIYQFEDVPVGQTYVLQINSGRFSFQNPTRVVNLDDSITDEDFIAVDAGSQKAEPSEKQNSPKLMKNRLRIDQ